MKIWLYEKIRKILNELDRIETNISFMAKEIRKMAGEVDLLVTRVTAIEGAADSIITLVTDLSIYIKNNAYDPILMLKLADDLDKKSAAIQAAVLANPVPPPVEPPV